MTARDRWRWPGLLAAGVALGLVAVVSVLVLAAAAAGALTTPPGAWVVRLAPLPGAAIRVSVPGLARLATSPTGLRLLDGRAVTTRFGELHLARDGGALRVVCAPCRFDDARLAAQTVRIDRLQLRLTQADERTLAGELEGGGVHVQFTARLQPERIDIDWRLPPTELAAVYRLFGSVVPEAHLARIDGRIDARGNLRLPQRQARIEVAVDGFAVDGLGTEALAEGPIAFTCPGAAAFPSPRRVVPGAGRWISPTRSGALLASAVLAAEDQRFDVHEGFDRVEIANVLASVGEDGPRRGASTITQQLARTLFTGGERTAARKLRELLYAVEMERTLGKRAILALYLNTVHWGPDICGADAAARSYFDKRPHELTPLEAAWLASILPSPTQAYEKEFLAGAGDAEPALRVLRRMRDLPGTERERWAAQALSFAAPPALRALPPRLAAAPD